MASLSWGWCTSGTLLKATHFNGIKAFDQLRNTWNWKNRHWFLHSNGKLRLPSWFSVWDQFFSKFKLKKIISVYVMEWKIKLWLSQFCDFFRRMKNAYICIKICHWSNFMVHLARNWNLQAWLYLSM